jgi:hypothetical protein
MSSGGVRCPQQAVGLLVKHFRLQERPHRVGVLRGGGEAAARPRVDAQQQGVVHYPQRLQQRAVRPQLPLEPAAQRQSDVAAHV